ncbi:redoxin domain-containing protein [Cellulomonas sp.]|uniref:redoxin domain-containing protein n=1 Tax=Cellulomonas sp. TaxID=40001 RepID=UPI001B1D27B4|nr:redoxin domain-containing protein [Cellulomonas sp.]MBO9555135.1 redoxin domain-containing protein [Cellulomonas sp.]
MSRTVRRGYVDAVAALTVVVLVAALWHAVAGDPAWLSVAGAWLVTAAAIAGAKLHVPRHPRTVDTVTLGLSGTAAVASVLLTRSAVAGALSLAATAALLGYQRWYTRQHRPAPTLAVGDPLPDFPLQHADGTPATSADLVGEPRVILFYRGSWCPFCVAQVRSLAEQYRELDRRGVKVALVSPQPAHDTAELATRFDVPMTFYVDPHGAAARTLDLVQPGGVPLALGAGTDGDTVVPTVVITDASGRVVWLQHSDDHRVRPVPSTFLEVIDSAGIGVAR